MQLTQVGMSKPGSLDRNCFNDETFEGNTIEETLELLEKETGIKVPKNPKGIFVDKKDGRTVQVGIISCRWNGDDNSSWWEENWITFYEKETRNIELPKFLKDKNH